MKKYFHYVVVATYITNARNINIYIYIYTHI